MREKGKGTGIRWASAISKTLLGVYHAVPPEAFTTAIEWVKNRSWRGHATCPPTPHVALLRLSASVSVLPTTWLCSKDPAMENLLTEGRVQQETKKGSRALMPSPVALRFSSPWRRTANLLPHCLLHYWCLWKRIIYIWMEIWEFTKNLWCIIYPHFTKEKLKSS